MTVRVSDIRGWIAWLETFKNKRGRRLGGGTIRHHLNTLSNLYRRAQEEEVVIPGFNPVAALMEKPAGSRQEARWLEMPEAALVFEAARQLPPLAGTVLDREAMERLRAVWEAGRFRSKRAAARAYGVSDVVIGRILRGEQEAVEPIDDARPAYVLVALFLLTGCRFREVAGLEVSDPPGLGVRPPARAGGTLLVPSWTASGEERRSWTSPSCSTAWRGVLGSRRAPSEAGCSATPTARPGSRHSTAARR
jgi:integrase